MWVCVWGVFHHQVGSGAWPLQEAALPAASALLIPALTQPAPLAAAAPVRSVGLCDQDLLLAELKLLRLPA